MSARMSLNWINVGARCDGYYTQPTRPSWLSQPAGERSATAFLAPLMLDLGDTLPLALQHGLMLGWWARGRMVRLRLLSAFAIACSQASTGADGAAAVDMT